MPALKYNTIKTLGKAELVEKRSRFIATVKPVYTEEEALEFLAQLRQKYWDARHNVYAYIIRENNIQRYSDDGEPAGTAGVPVLDFLKKQDLHDLIVVVTRYFGGVLLGTGGLVRAYSKSAKLGVEAAGVLEMLECTHVTIDCDYTLLGIVQNEISKFDLIKEEIVYTDKVSIPLYIPTEETERFVSKITSATNAYAKITVGETCYKGRTLLISDDEAEED